MLGGPGATETAAIRATAPIRDAGLPIALRLALVATVPAMVSVAIFATLAGHGTRSPADIVAALVLLAAAGALVLWQARAIVDPLRAVTERCEQLAMRFSAEPRAKPRTELGGLAAAFDVMSAAVIRSQDEAGRAAREEAQTTLDLQRQYALMQMLRNLASLANGGDSLDRALQCALREVGAYLDWPLGRLLQVTRGGGQSPESHPETFTQTRSHWYAPDPERFAGFIDATNGGPLEPGTSGLIGRARQSNLAHWVSDISRLDGWHRRDAAIACGLHSGFVIPVAVGADMLAFIEFFSEHRIEAGDDMLELVEAISVELWRTANRYQAEAALRITGSRARRLASIVEAMDEAVAVLDTNGRAEWINAGMTRLVGQSAPQSSGRDVAALLFPQDGQSAEECRRQIQSGDRIRGLVLPSHNITGAPRWYELEIQAMPDRAELAAGTFLLVRDITQERNTQQALTAALEDARQASQSKSQFLANMSHEIRTPMNGVLGMAELLLGTELDDRQRRFIESLYRSGESLLDIINDILDFSKIEAGKLELECIDFDLRALIEDLVELLAPRAHQKRIELAYTLSPGLPATVRGDPTRLRQVLINVIGNAIKFTERGEVVLDVEPLAAEVAVPAAATPAHAAVAPVSRVRFVVRDTGIGMRPEAVERLFSVFMQADQSSSRRYGGTGLGLAICRQLTELMDGHISATSRLGEGSVFTVELPLRHGDPAAVAARPVPVATVAGKRVLIAEDNPTNRRILHEQLRALEMDCALAENGRQALQMLRIAARSASPFDVAVIDMKMPIMDGMMLAEQVRMDAALAGVRLVMLTSITGRDEARRAQAIGVDAYLAKPVRQQELVATLSVVLGSAPAERVSHAAASHIDGLAGRSILVVEDNPVNQEVVTAMLDALGCRSRVAEDGLVALGLLEREDFDAVLMDCQMPTMDGFEAMRRLRDPDYRQHDLSRARRTPVIALTANALSGDAERCREAGFSDYLAKPFRQQELGGMLVRWVRDRDTAIAATAPALPATAAAAATARAAPPAEPLPVRPTVTDEPILDERVLKDILAMERNGARDLLRRLVTTYAQSSTVLVDNAVQAFARQDAVAVAQALHTLKSSSANLGAMRFSRACGRIEACARQSDLPSAEPIWHAVRADHGQVVAALLALAPDAGGPANAAGGSRAAAVES